MTLLSEVDTTYSEVGADYQKFPKLAPGVPKISEGDSKSVEDLPCWRKDLRSFFLSLHQK